MAKAGTKAKKKKARPKLTNKKQSERFIEMALALGVDETGKTFEDTFSKIAKQPKK